MNVRSCTKIPLTRPVTIITISTYRSINKNSHCSYFPDPINEHLRECFFTGIVNIHVCCCLPLLSVTLLAAVGVGTRAHRYSTLTQGIERILKNYSVRLFQFGWQCWIDKQAAVTLSFINEVKLCTEAPMVAR